MASEHIDRFNLVATNILKALHSSFPAPFHPTPETIGLTDEEPVIVSGRRQNSGTYEELSKETKRVIAVLIDEGFVHDRQYQIGPSYIITTNGLRALECIDSAFPAPFIAGT